MLAWEVLVGIALCLAFAVGIIGNISVCIVILLNSTMHTSTNCFLFSLAISDLQIIIGDLLPWILNWFDIHYGPGVCVFSLLTSTFATYITLLTIVAVSVTRYIVICHPFIQYRVNDFWKTIVVIITIWMLGSFVALPQTYKYMDHCNYADRNIYVSDSYKFKTTLIYLIIFFTVIIVIGILYLLIHRELKRSCRMACPKEIAQEENKNVTKILVTILISLFICWTPLQVCQLVYYYSNMQNPTIEERIAMNDVMRIVEPIAGFLFFFICTTINPFIYNILSDQFREAFKKTFRLKRRSEESTFGNCTTEVISIDSKSV